VPALWFNKVLIVIIRFLAVTILYFVCFAVVSGALLSTATKQPAPAEAGTALLALFVISLINAAVWTYVILRSRWTGWQLILAVLLVFFGVGTLMPQIETAYFITRLPPGMLPRLFRRPRCAWSTSWKQRLQTSCLAGW